MIDIQETLVKGALRGTGDFFDEKDLVVRVPRHCEKCTYVMLIDSSDSMRGKKIIGAIEAAIALKRAIKGKDFDKLYVIAFNHKARKISENEILNLEARGRTDIGLALKKARDILIIIGHKKSIIQFKIDILSKKMKRK
jgi:Ca-activated chloride channel family protein